MLRPFVFAALAAALVIPSSRPAAAEDTPPAANVEQVEMMVDAMLNGKDVWSPGGRELHWSPSKCPYKIQFKGQVKVDKPTKITYRWERSDGEKSADLTFDVKTAGTLVDVTPTEALNLGKPGQTFRGAHTFHVLTPTDISTTTPIKVECGG
jgi:hypothetical protein